MSRIKKRRIGRFRWNVWNFSLFEWILKLELRNLIFLLFNESLRGWKLIKISKFLWNRLLFFISYFFNIIVIYILYTNSEHLILNIFAIFMIYPFIPFTGRSCHKIKTIRLYFPRISWILISCFCLSRLNRLSTSFSRSYFNPTNHWTIFHLRICLILARDYTDNSALCFRCFNHPPRYKRSIFSFNKLLVLNFQLNYLFNLWFPWFLLLLLYHQLNFFLDFLIPNLA